MNVFLEISGFNLLTTTNITHALSIDIAPFKCGYLNLTRNYVTQHDVTESNATIFHDTYYRGHLPALIA